MAISKHVQILVLVLFPVYLSCMENSSHDWIQEALSCQHAGAWKVQDKNGKPVVVEGGLISKDCKLLSSESDLKNVAAMFADVMEQTVIDWTKASRCVRYYIKCRSFFTGQSVRDRRYGIYYEKMQAPMQQDDGNLYYLFAVSEQSGDNKTLLGAVIFDIKRDYAYGTVELDLLSVKPEAQSRGLSTILSSAIFNFLPQAKRIILDALATNKVAIGTYEYFGFARYQKECGCFMSLIEPEYHYEYLVESPKCQKLQARAATFKDIKN